MLKLLSSHQIAEWQAYDLIEPFGNWADWFRAGIIAATIANVHAGKRSTTFQPQDFMPKEFGPELVRQSVEEQKAIMMGIAKAFERAGKLKRRKRKR